MANRKQAIILDALVARLAAHDDVSIDDINRTYKNIIFDSNTNLEDLADTTFTVYWAASQDPERIGALRNEYIEYPIFSIQVLYRAPADVADYDIQKEMLNHKAKFIQHMIDWDFSTTKDAQNLDFIHSVDFIGESKLPPLGIENTEAYEFNLQVSYKTNGVF